MDNSLMSLYDYLGKAAGIKLGEEVNKVAQLKNIPARTRNISNLKYSGTVMLYPKWFLDEYFGNTQKEDDDELPF